MRFIHLSDLHFHRHPSDNVAVIALLDFIQQHYPHYKLIVTGDIVDDGDEKQFEEAFRALEPFTGRIFICPGNHDFGAAGNFYSQERGERFDQLLSKRLLQGGTFTGDNTPVVNVVSEGGERTMLIALDTNLETDHPFDFACGEVGEEQLASLKTILVNPATAGMIKMVFFHHHPFMHGNPFMQLTDARQLMRILYGRVQVVLFGHKHVSGFWTNMNGISYVLAADNSPGKNVAREVAIDQNIISIKDLPIV